MVKGSLLRKDRPLLELSGRPEPPYLDENL